MANWVALQQMVNFAMAATNCSTLSLGELREMNSPWCLQVQERSSDRNAAAGQLLNFVDAKLVPGNISAYNELICSLVRCEQWQCADMIDKDLADKCRRRLQQNDAKHGMVSQQPRKLCLSRRLSYQFALYPISLHYLVPAVAVLQLHSAIVILPAFYRRHLNTHDFQQTHLGPFFHSKLLYR